MIDHKIINAICKTHTSAYLEIIREMVTMGIPLNKIKHDFEQPHDEEYITYENVGWHLMKDWDGDGNVTVKAEPGEFVPSNVGRQWIRRITKYHSVVGNYPQ